MQWNERNKRTAQSAREEEITERLNVLRQEEKDHKDRNQFLLLLVWIALVVGTVAALITFTSKRCEVDQVEEPAHPRQ